MHWGIAGAPHAQGNVCLSEPPASQHGESRHGHPPACGGDGLEEANAFAIWDMDACAEAARVLLSHVL